MVRATVSTENGDTVLSLSGTMSEERFDYPLLPPEARRLLIRTRELSRINSTGVKAWIHFCHALTAEGRSFAFVECSPAIVEQLSNIRNFSGGGEVRSAYVPYHCDSCETDFTVLFDRASLERIRDQPVIEHECTSCKATAQFDDLAEEYFRFLDY
jgi:anti-anti-sigma regulatory factor